MLNDLIDKRARVWDQMCAMRDAVKDREFTGEERTSWDAAMTNLESLSGDIERIEKADSLARKIATKDIGTEGRASGSQDSEYREAFYNYLRTGEQSQTLREGLQVWSTGEQRALGIATGGAGGYTVPQGFRDVFIERLKFYNSVRTVADDIQTDSGQLLPWPTNDDTANVGAILGENTAVTNQDIALAQTTLSAYMYTSKQVLVSFQLLQDNAVNLETRIPTMLARRIGRIQNQHFTTGTGTGQPLGLISGNVSNIATQAATGSTTKLVYADLVAAIAKVDPAYQQGGNCKWMLSQTALAAAMSIVDTQQRPLWQPSLQAGIPNTLLGFEYVLNNDLAVPAVNALVGAFGDFKAGYIVRDTSDPQVLRLNERYADSLQVGFIGFQRTDATVQDPNAYVVLKQAAS